jgi:hypothetical protein
MVFDARSLYKKNPVIEPIMRIGTSHTSTKGHGFVAMQRTNYVMKTRNGNERRTPMPKVMDDA